MRIKAVQFHHQPVTRNLGDDAGGGDGIAKRVAVDDAAHFLGQLGQGGLHAVVDVDGGLVGIAAGGTVMRLLVSVAGAVLLIFILQKLGIFKKTG